MILEENNDAAIRLAIKSLQLDNLIILPTDTIYGIAANAKSDIAVQKIYDIKKRNKNKAIAVFVKNIQEIENNFYLNNLERKFITKYFPGAATIILKPKKNKLSKFLNQNDDSLAVRIPNHQFCLKLLEKFDDIMAVSSSNISGMTAIRDINLLQTKFGDKVDLIISGEFSKDYLASTIVKIEGKEVKVLRPGKIDIKPFPI
jgi:L-threonylcarbamoyladenylate synthase